MFPTADRRHRAAPWTGTTTYQAITDGTAHTDRFDTLGIGGSGVVEAPPSSLAADQVVSAAFAAPSAPNVTGSIVQNGEVERSYIPRAGVRRDGRSGRCERCRDRAHPAAPRHAAGSGARLTRRGRSPSHSKITRRRGPARNVLTDRTARGFLRESPSRLPRRIAFRNGKPYPIQNLWR
jgi:hypothetical protein